MAKRKYHRDFGVPMETALSPEQCKKMRKFLAAVCQYHKTTGKMSFGKFAREWRRTGRVYL